VSNGNGMHDGRKGNVTMPTPYAAPRYFVRQIETTSRTQVTKAAYITRIHQWHNPGWMRTRPNVKGLQMKEREKRNNTIPTNKRCFSRRTGLICFSRRRKRIRRPVTYERVRFIHRIGVSD
jgi:hypothetical protein